MGLTLGNGSHDGDAATVGGLDFPEIDCGHADKAHKEGAERLDVAPGLPDAVKVLLTGVGG